jgi:hypothetical protein
LSQVISVNCSPRLRSLGIISAPASACVDLGEIVEHLAKGTYLFKKPEVAILDERFPIRLTLLTQANQKVDMDDLPGSLVRRENRPFAQSVEATLSGDDLDISPSGPQSRTATFAAPVEWNWTVKPVAHGTKTLTIEVNATITAGSDKHRVQITTLRETIAIKVTMLQWFKAYVADVSGVVLAAAALVAPLGVLFGFVPTVRKFVGGLFSPFRRTRGTAPKQ